jgi:ADP-heptose:LPS heptosyltransferase
MANESMLRRPEAPDYATGHAIENNLAMAHELGIDATTHRLSMPHLIADSAGQERLLLIHPGASRENKRWPVENWARVADTLAAQPFACPIALTGDRSEVSLTAQVAAAMKTRPRMLAGKLSLPELARLQSGALALLSGDTGPYHLAVSVGCPTVTLFAPTDRGSSREACGPHQADATFHRSVQTALPGDSIQTISPEQVLAEAGAVLSAVYDRIASRESGAPP